MLAESGLLNQQRATTTWWLAPMFRERYPQVLLDESDMVVKSGKVVTAGAALGHMDLALWLIRGVSPELASLTARYLIVDSRPSQTAYALTDHLIHSDPVVQLFERWRTACTQVFPRQRRESRRREQKDAYSAATERPWQIADVVFSKSAC